ncbi:MAG TPA: hypothetical protein VF426_02905 [Marmoricola sp.]
MKRTVVALLALLLAFTVAACGSSKSLSGESASALLKKARAAVAAEKYVSISGKINEGGKATSIDLHYVGDDAYGTIVLAGATIKLESVGGKTFIKPNDAFWKQQLSAEQAKVVSGLIGDRWIIADAKDSNFAQLISLTNRDFLTKDMLKPSAKTKVSKGKVTSVDGEKAIPLTLDKSTLYLDDSSARPIQVSGSGGGSTGTAKFSYDKVNAPSAPAAKDQADLAKLIKGQ